MSENVIDFRKKKGKAILSLRMKHRLDDSNAEDKRTVITQILRKLRNREVVSSLVVSAILVLLIIVTVPSLAGIIGACIAASAILLYLTNKDGNPAYKESLMLLGWGAAVFLLDSIYPLDNLRMPLGIILSGMMIASFFYLYKNTPLKKG